MANRPELHDLYAKLIASKFGFLGRGQHELTDIYSAVRQRFPLLCDNDYLCGEHCKSGHPTQPEWKHRTRSALNSLRKLGHVAGGSHRAAWIINATLPAPSLTQISTTEGRGDGESKVIRNRSGGAGFGSAAENSRVERAAMRCVIRYYGDRGWEVRDVSAGNQGYDLFCKKGAAIRHIEVKGAGGDSEKFIITANEAQTWESDSRYVLALVTNALSKKPSLTEFVGPQGRQGFTFDPISYWAKRRAP